MKESVSLAAFFGWVCLFSAGWSGPAHARLDPPMIEIGSGADVTTQGVDVLLRVNIDNLTVHRAGGRVTWVLARIKGNLSMDTGSDGRRIPYSDIEFVPVTFRTGAGLSGVGVRVLPTRLGTNVRLDQDLVVRVAVAGVETAHLGPSGVSERILVYAKVAADALGFKLANHAHDALRFRGLGIGAVNAEVGAILAAPSGFKVRVAFGASADISVGDGPGQGWSVRSDMAAYNEVSVDLWRFLRLFVRNGVNAVTGTGFDDRAEYQLMAGATFIF